MTARPGDGGAAMPDTDTALRIDDRVAVVTGAGSGIGRALALRIAEAGGDVAIADIDADALARTAADIAARGRGAFVRALDVTDADATDRFAADSFAWADDRAIPLVFANAGIHGIGSVVGADLALWNRVLAVNVMGPVHMARAFIPRLTDRGAPAQFVVTGSQGSFVAAPGLAPYIASKHAVWGLADTLRLEQRASGSPVGISLVAPSRTASAMVQPQIDAARARGGDAAAQAYQSQLIGPDAVAAVMLREALARRFWIVPSHENVDGVVRDRFAELQAAFAHGRIAPGRAG